MLDFTEEAALVSRVSGRRHLNKRDVCVLKSRLGGVELLEEQSLLNYNRFIVDELDCKKQL